MAGKQKPTGQARDNIDRLVNEHGDVLYAYAMMRLGRQDAAEDIVQETLLAALQSWETFAGQSSERTWLIGILRHKILDFFRRERPSQNTDDEAWRDEFFDRARHWKDKLLDWQGDPEALAENHEFRQVLQNCLDRLSEIMAQAFVLREMEGLSSEEICQHLAITPTNLWARLHRARLQLRRCLQQNWFL